MMYVSLDKAIYFAPRGRKRLMQLGALISQRYLSPEDRLVGFVGGPGAGKSLLIRGMFPGLVLTNDDSGVNLRPAPLLDDYESGRFRTHTYHIDVRFESAFTPLHVQANAIHAAVHEGKRVIVEHFELVFRVLGMNAECLVGVGDEVIVTRPGHFGPYPEELASIVFPSLRYRKMAHSAEDLTSIVLESMGVEKPEIHSDVKNGFVVEFSRKPEIDTEEVEAEVAGYIARDLEIAYYDEEHILIGDKLYPCSGPRLHVQRTAEIEGFRLIREIKYCKLTNLYLLAGLVGHQDAGDNSL